MRTVDLIQKKRDAGELARDEIAFLVRGFTDGHIPDYQMSAFLMAVRLCGMTEAETAALTEEMRDSGAVLDLHALPGRKIDKHSTGGVGDKTSLILAPVVAAAGIVVPMISGRGLGHTGGTLDKLEAIPGFNVRLSLAQFRRALESTGAAMIGQTDDLAPADRKLYALRDVTATIDSIPLIVGSIMSKKLAEGIDGLVLDVKTGSGAFMKTREESARLARAMVGIGRAAGTSVVALVTDMSQPLGAMAGNALEVMEAIEVLRGGGPPDVVRLCRELSAHCLVLGQAAPDLDAARGEFDRIVASGLGAEKLRAIIRTQGGKDGVVDDPGLLPRARRTSAVRARTAGHVAAIDTTSFGLALCLLGAGRETVESEIDPAVGVRVEKKIGDAVEAGEPLVTIHYNDETRLEEARRRMFAAYSFSRDLVAPPELIQEVIA